MSAPPLELPPSHSTSGHHDGLGRRTLRFDREDGMILERLQLRPELWAFETPLRERLERAAAFEDERFARVRAIEHDPAGGLTVVSEFVAGNRVCDLLEAASGLSAEEATSLSVDAALGFLLEILPALAALHSVAGFSHGAVGPDRTVLTPTGQVVLLDSIFGHTLERLQFNRRRLWTELRIAAPAAAGPTRFDIAADLGQASLTAVMIVIGRLLTDNEYPDGLTAVVNEVVEIAQIRGSARFASGLHQFLERTLPIPGRKPYATADEAAAELRQLAREIGIDRCRAALVSFVDDMNRNLEAIETSAAWSGRSAIATEAEPIAASEYDLTFDEDVTVAATDDEELVILSAEDEEPIFVAEEPIAADENAISFELLEAFVTKTPAVPIAPEEDPEPVAEPAYEPIAESVYEPIAEPVYEPEAIAETVYEPIAEPVYEPEAIAEPVYEPIAEPVYEPEPIVEPVYEPEPIPEYVAEIQPELERAYEPIEAPIEPVPEELVAAQSETSIPPASPDEDARTLVGRDPVRELAVENEIDLVRERFAAQAERVAEPRIAFDESFPDPTLEKPSAPLLELQQETAAWRAAFVAADEQKPEPIVVAPEPVAEPEPPAASARKRKRGNKADRDKLRSNAPTRAVPVFVPPPEVRIAPITMAPAARMPTPLYVPQAMPVYTSNQPSAYGQRDPVFQAPPPPPMAPAAPATIGLRVKQDLPSGYTPVVANRENRRESHAGMTALPYVQRGAPESGPFPWKPIAGVVVAVLVGVGVGFTYWPNGKAAAPAPVETVSTKPPAATAGAVAAAVLTGKAGSIVITTLPPGARVLLDGKEQGDSPMTLEGVAPGRHTLTFVTASVTVKKTVKVELGKTLTLDVPVGNGWIAVFAPITLDIAENGKAIGTAEQGRLILSPGPHELTLSNRDFGYSETRTVEVEPNEERSITVRPTGEVNLQAVPWAEVWIDGKKIETTPIKLQVPLGTHEIVFKHPQFGERNKTAVVTASTPLMLTVDFTKP